MFVFVRLPKPCTAAENMKSSGRTRVDERNIEQFLRFFFYSLKGQWGKFYTHLHIIAMDIGNVMI